MNSGTNETANVVVVVPVEPTNEEHEVVQGLPGQMFSNLSAHIRHKGNGRCVYVPRM